ncbi:MAG TPA: hypothetical protein VG847_06785 [Chitinophagaceae bacterium]|nr:hypothetical protein [Chitinophagaceae bacterium]
MKVLYAFFLFFISPTLFAQNFNGQWRGSFNETSYGFSGLGSDNIDYVLELQISGTDVSGYSYTYFNEGGKRYYTICKLTGTLNRSTKDIVITETERVKYNTPPGFQNCFQTHKLHYERDSTDTESLRGTWIPAPNQDGNCGYGTTLLSRKMVKSYTAATTPGKKNGNKPTVTKENKPATTKKTSPPVARKDAPQKSITKKPASKPVAKAPSKTKPTAQPEVTKKQEDEKIQPTIMPDIKKTDTLVHTVKNFEPRRKDIIKTISISQPTFKVDFYDNGEIDGDSITVFYNGRIVLLHKMLSDRPITLTLSLDENVKENVITMYADNLGSIPPNTALMIVHDGDKRYEVRIESDTQKSGSVVFTHAQ